MHRVKRVRPTGAVEAALNAYMEEKRMGSMELALKWLIPDLRTLCDDVGFSWDEIMNSAGLIQEDEDHGAICTSKIAHTKPDKGYGFTTCGVFLHVKSGFHVGSTGTDQPENIGPMVKMLDVGQLVVFEKRSSERYERPYAEYWYSHKEYVDAIKAIKERSTYRLESLSSGLVRWEGQDLGKLRMLYPKGHDFMKNGLVIKKRVTTPTGWYYAECEDPR